jgi:hypothetical protein
MAVLVSKGTILPEDIGMVVRLPEVRSVNVPEADVTTVDGVIIVESTAETISDGMALDDRIGV